jgi:hypothetical protein
VSEARVAQLRIQALRRLRVYLSAALDLTADERIAA